MVFREGGPGNRGSAGRSRPARSAPAAFPGPGRGPARPRRPARRSRTPEERSGAWAASTAGTERRHLLDVNGPDDDVEVGVLARRLRGQPGAGDEDLRLAAADLELQFGEGAAIVDLELALL